MKSIIVLLLITLSSISFAQTEKRDCIQAYVEAFSKLEQETRNFNQRYTDNYEFALQVSGISTVLTSVRGFCHFFEDPKQKSCVLSLKARYKKLRNKISVPALIAGNQAKVSLSFLDNLGNAFKKELSTFECIRDGITVYKPYTY